jgi:hypothetical protein
MFICEKKGHSPPLRAMVLQDINILKVFHITRHSSLMKLVFISYYDFS